MTTSLAFSEPARGPSLPWASGGCVLIAFAAFALFQRDLPMPLLCALLFAVPWFMSFESRSAPLPFQLALRTVMYAVAAVYSRFSTSDFQGVLVYTGYVVMFTRFCMIELTLLHFGFNPYRRANYARPAALFLSGIVFAAASKTVDVEARFIYFAVPYFFCAALSLRDVRVRARSRNLAWLTPKVWSHGVLLVAALALGVVFSRYVGTHKRQLAPFFRLSPFTPTAAPTQPANVGFNDSPVLGSVQNSARSLERVMTIRGRVSEPHLRGLAFDTYSAGRWLASNNAEKFDLARLAAGSNDARADVLRLSDYISNLFVPLQSSGVSCEQPEALECDVDSGYALKAFAPAPFHYRFTLSDTPGWQGPLCVPLQGEQHARCLAIPRELDGRVRALAQEITRACPSELEKAHAIEAWLKNNIKYSLGTRMGRGDPVSDFVLNKRAAHCEFFASAAVLMLRCAGVPARYVTGYYAHESDGDNSYVVRQQDAHAWAECWVGGSGWVTIDATPAAGIPFNLGQHVSPWRRVSEWFADVFYAVLHRARGMTWREWAASACVAAAVCAGVVWWRRRRRPGSVLPQTFTYSTAMPAAVEMAARFERYLARRRIPCAENVTWQEHLALLAAADASIRRGVDLPRCIAFARRFSAVRFGGDTQHAELPALHQELESIEKSG